MESLPLLRALPCRYIVSASLLEYICWRCGVQTIDVPEFVVTKKVEHVRHSFDLRYIFHPSNKTRYVLDAYTLLKI